MNNQTKTAIVKMMDRGLLVIPNEMRKKTGISKGAYLRVTLKPDGIFLAPLTDEKKDQDHYFVKGIKITKAKYSKDERLKILSKIGKISWTKEDDKFLAQGRKQIEERLKSYDSL